ncbi:cytochrome-c oxidase, cbb3-type subunit III [Dokdonella sp.]|uniref:cytochrome-c oxidase, cbb3-type subunit III n=1 Tax=Dokdonella sp. TaxID=2291710 RepID=UPI0025B82332|nr:cytochrome-c oxidase, cbb3-type subunit III [Dokdonella sp.]MBX3690038.1 cytochrome-c oxidase, cbb3-type subunit III [Dokdonella sp.]
MSPFWSGWIMFLIVLNLGITLFLFLWGPRVKIPTLPDGTTGHVWAHGVLREGMNRLPLWWIVMSGAMFVIGFTYLYLYPGFGSSKGSLGWTSHQQLADDIAANRAKLDPVLTGFAGKPVDVLAADSTATRMGERLFVDNCAACHGREAHGNRVIGAPNLVDATWIYGGDGDTLLTSILDGRHGVMPPFSSSLDKAAIENLANYVLSLSGRDHSPAKARLGADNFAVCAACHGPTGTGNPALGAPNLTTADELYGRDLATIEQTIRNGRSGVMPAWRTRLTDTDARLIAAWVYARSHANAAH